MNIFSPCNCMHRTGYGTEQFACLALYFLFIFYFLVFHKTSPQRRRLLDTFDSLGGYGDYYGWRMTVLKHLLGSQSTTLKSRSLRHIAPV